uniref:Nitrogenase iron protein n=1 Tax=Candidatus Methanophaga sp. ANME-1 ERB7 TaxID=2759913 RepID=A0A7G9ZCT2_9EURY|nr:nitrogenase iron protein [Methanosarcinales archaeon ANME-1 ERB7]
MVSVNIAFAHHKGGTGKTTSCVNISGFLALSAKKVLVIDLDPQANATSALGIDKNNLGESMYDVMVGDAEIADAILETEIENIHLAPATIDLVGAESHLYRINNRISILKRSIEGIRRYYDYIMIDTPPGPGLFIINGVVASDYTIVTLDPGVFALEGIETLNLIFDDVNESSGVRINPRIAILTRCNKASLFSKITGKRDPVKEIKKGMKEFFDSVYTVPYGVEVYEAQLKGVPISHYKPKCKAGVAYKKIAEVVRR